MVPDGNLLFRSASRITPNIVYYLPRNVEICQLAELAGNGNTFELEEMYLNSKLKVVTVYFGKLATGVSPG